MREIADKIAKLTLSIPVQTGQGGKLFGAVTTHHITEALAKENVTVDHRKIELKHPIHSLGTFGVEINLHPEVKASLKFSVVSLTAPGAEEAAERLQHLGQVAHQLDVLACVVLQRSGGEFAPAGMFRERNPASASRRTRASACWRNAAGSNPSGSRGSSR